MNTCLQSRVYHGRFCCFKSWLAGEPSVCLSRCFVGSRFCTGLQKSGNQTQPKSRLPLAIVHREHWPMPHTKPADQKQILNFWKLVGNNSKSSGDSFNSQVQVEGLKRFREFPFFLNDCTYLFSQFFYLPDVSSDFG